MIETSDVVEAAFAAPDPRPWHANLKYFEAGGSTRRLDSACWNLQKLHGDEPFSLTCRDVGKQLGIEVRAAWKKLRTLEAFTPLTRVSTGKGRKASEYRYVGQWPIIPRLEELFRKGQCDGEA